MYHVLCGVIANLGITAKARNGNVTRLLNETSKNCSCFKSKVMNECYLKKRGWENFHTDKPGGNVQKLITSQIELCNIGQCG